MFNIKNAYYVVGGSTTQVYSTASNTYVPVDDQGYQDWLAAGNSSNVAVDEADLWETVQRLGLGLPLWMFDGTTFVQPAVGAYSKSNLLGYNGDARYRRASSGVTITTISAVSFQSDPQSRNTVNSAYDYSQAQGTNWTINWKMQDGSFVVLSKGSLATLMNNMAQFVQACFTCEYDNQTKIDGGTITTPTQIDAAFAAVSNVFP
jgi:hypothetical protein